jgi:hypothetical protein
MDPELGWNSLKTRLIEDLSADGAVLPIRMSVALKGLVSLPGLTAKDYVKLGGLEGLEAEFILERCAAAALITKLKSLAVLHVLLALCPEHDDVVVSLSLQEVLAKVDQKREQLSGLLEYLESKNIVRRRLNPDTDEERWSLYHDYLSHGVREAERRLQRWSVLLREHYQTYLETGPSFSRRWWALLSPWNQIVLLYQGLRGRLPNIYGRYRALSLLRWVPYAGFALAWLLLADAGLNFPTADAIRGHLDEWRISVFRTIYTDQQIQQASSRMLAVISKELADRTTAGWAQSGGNNPPQGHDNWLQPQVVTAQLRMEGPDVPTLGRLFERMSFLFDPQSTKRDSQGKELGWEQTTGIGYTRVEPLLWAGNALAIMYGKLKADDSRRNTIGTWLVQLQDMADSYYMGDGGWNRFPKQVDRELRSTYASTLALLMLLESRASKFDLSIAGKPRDELILETFQWLINRHDYMNDPPGWREHPTNKKETVSPILTLFVDAALSRAATEMPQRDIESLTTPAIQTLRSGFKENVTERLGIVPEDVVRLRLELFLPDVPDKKQTFEATVGFLWYPWAIEAARRGIKRASALGWTSTEKARARQNLGKLVVEMGDHYVEEFIDKETFTFKATELAYVLSPLTADLWSRPDAPAVK